MRKMVVSTVTLLVVLATLTSMAIADSVIIGPKM